ncbi:MAG: ribosome biogenesis GTPase Der [Clostridia bacterium]
MNKRIVAVVGRPNVGKSTFFNKITGKRNSIVADTPGVTRDRIYADTEWNGVPLMCIDTGGIEPITDNLLLQQMRDQAQIAIDIADVIIFLVDLQSGVTANDRDIATMLKRTKKPIILAVNKCDKVGGVPAEIYEFYELGLGDPMPVSSLHGSGTGDILDEIIKNLPDDELVDDDEPVINVAVVGRPNSGKSSIVNCIAGEERVIVSDVAGTTRDAIDTPIKNKYGNYNFIDTAGIRRNAKIEDRIEKYSVLRANLAVERADVCVVMLDANEGVTSQDERIAGIGHNAGKASILVVNKWDTVDKDNDTVNKFKKLAYDAVSYMTYAPILFVSAKTGQRVEKLYEMINSVYEQSSKRITTGLLNDVLNDATARVQPPSDKGRRLKIYYMTQTGTKPPTFVIFCNNAELFHFSYQRYIENCLRKTFGFEGTPIKIVVRQKGDDESKL